MHRGDNPDGIAGLGWYRWAIGAVPEGLPEALPSAGGADHSAANKDTSHDQDPRPSPSRPTSSFPS